MPSASASDTTQLHQALVDQLASAGHIRNPRVEAAFRAVPRHPFLPDIAPDEVYRDTAIVTKRADGQPISSSSQPAIMAIMLEQLDLQPGQRVLEIGTGTGYNAALLSHIAGAEGQVVTIELDEDTVNFAREHLSAAGFDRVQVICGDGASGFAGAAPYDRIILSVGASDIHPAWREQLKPKGRLVLPLSIRVAQESVAFEPAGDHLRSVSIKDCSFMLLRGPNAAPERMIQLHPLPDLRIAIHSEAAIDAQTTQQQLAGSSQDWPTDIHVKPEEIWGGLNLWLALGEPGYCDVWSEGTERLLPDLFRLSETMGLTTGLISRNGLCVLMRSPNSSPDKPEAAPLGLAVRSYGADDALRLRLLDHIHAWDAAGRPGSDRLKIRAYSLPSHHRPSPSEIVIDKQYTQLVLAW